MLNQKALAASVSAGPKTYVEDVFSTWLYTGNGSTQTITNGIDLSGKGGLVWTKNRSATANHFLIDSARNNDSYLISNSTGGEASAGSTFNVVFNSNGFTDGLSNRFFSGDNIASWTFRKAEKFFDVVTYTGNGVSGRQISHNLGSTPGVVIVKRTDTAGTDWIFRHRSIPVYSGALNTTGDFLASGSGMANQVNDLESTYFSVGGNAPTNASGGTYVAYLFAHDAGGFGDSGSDSVVKCGSYTGTSSAGLFVDLGWEPQWVLIKNTTSSANWIVLDTMRGIATGSDDAYLVPNTSSTEGIFGIMDVNPTGFTLTQGSTLFNASSNTYIYIAIRRGPMKTPTVGTSVFDASTSSGASGTTITTNFAVDAQLIKNRTSVESTHAVDRLRGVNTTNATGQTVPYLLTASTNAEASVTNLAVSDNWGNTSFEIPGGFGSISTAYYSFRRAPGFFDVVAYTGTGSAQTVSHNLGVVPEFCIVKRRDATAFWPTWSSAFTSFQYVALNETSSKYDDGSSNQTFSFTSTGWSIGTTYSSVNASGATYIAYLFASCPGVSKVGSYTGTGTTLSVDCGFTAGARFVLIKRTDSTGDWYVWDTARGIVSGNDPYLLLNSTAAEVTSTDYIDPLSSGFQISSTAPAAINANGGSFIYLAVA
jgi:hypothetical protein